ncbi:hypothetical protein FACS1894172_21170 [Spirochaetia bacterium]|nr:hypothetical protein FACS1894172_21170 [Spirochaetia bacterium]
MDDDDKTPEKWLAAVQQDDRAPEYVPKELRKQVRSGGDRVRRGGTREYPAPGSQARSV